ncbi:MAG TPA: HDIG domain-containing protein [Thermomicrobiales bacterium]|nr:HDIG domain-containing protein [Thermomicrobiales bacterium]
MPPPIVTVLPGKGGNGAGPGRSGDKQRRARQRANRMPWLRRPINAEGNTPWQIIRLLLFSLAMALVLGAAIAPWNTVSQVDLPVGAVANRTFKAPRTMTYTSDVRTQEKRDEAANDDRLRVFNRNTTLVAAQQNQYDSDLRKLAEIRGSSTSLDDRVKAVQGIITDMTTDEARQLLLLDAPRWGAVTNAAKQLLDQTMAGTVTIEQLAQIKDDLPQRADPTLAQTERNLAAALAGNYIKPNQVEDTAETAKRRDAARAAVPPVKVTVQEGQTIVRDGDIVTRDQREQLEKLGLLQPQVHWSVLAGTLGLVLILVAMLTAYLYRFARLVWHGRQIMLLGLTICLPIVLARLVLSSHPTWVYAFPIAVSAMLTVVLFNLQLATVVAIIDAVAFGLLGGPGGSLAYATLAFAASVVGAFILWRADRILTFLWSGVAVIITVLLTGICFRLINNALDVPGLAQIALLASFNGGLTAVLTFGSFSFLGGLFGITTHLQLLELAHPNQPLLYKLAREAPGTYHHSIVVSNLAESAVERVGGDPLFTRVAVLYHDIGKTLRPTFFIENQANRDNVHDVLDPQQSAQIIIDHVTDGVRLAQKAHLPSSIVDIVRQHHGTMLIRYFYNKALQQGDEVREEDFRYPGPKPQTKEAGVIMLADSVEAAVRAAAQAGKLDFAEEPSRNGKVNGAVRRGAGSKLQDLINQVIDDRVKSGQLDECDLTLRDIDRIKQTFVQVLDGIYHPRIEYPPAPAAPARPKEVTQAPAG